MCPRYLAHKESTVDLRFGETPKATTSSTQPRMINVNASTVVNDTGWITFPILTVALCPMDLRMGGKMNFHFLRVIQNIIYPSERSELRYGVQGVGFCVISPLSPPRGLQRWDDSCIMILDSLYNKIWFEWRVGKWDKNLSYSWYDSWIGVLCSAR